MARITISPSQQPFNAYADGSGSEELHMERVAHIVASLLRAAGHTVLVPETGNYESQVPAANAWGCEAYVALHTDATGVAGAVRRGVSAWVMGQSIDPVGYQLADAITARVDAMNVGGRAINDGSHLWEVRGPVAPSCLIELDFHDNSDGARWIGENEAPLAQAVAEGICAVMGGTIPPISTGATTLPLAVTTTTTTNQSEEDDMPRIITDTDGTAWLLDGARIAPLLSPAEIDAARNVLCQPDGAQVMAGQQVITALGIARRLSDGEEAHRAALRIEEALRQQGGDNA